MEKNIYVDFVNGHVDHVHCLISLNANRTIAKILQLLKGESSFWINKNNLCKQYFEWQDEYFAMSVSESGVDAVREYISKTRRHTMQRKHLRRRMMSLQGNMDLY